MSNLTFQYYPASIETTKPLGFVTLEEFVNAIKNPADSIKEVFKKIAEAESSGDMETKAQLKQNNLFYFTPCVHSNGKSRGYKDITKFTGLAVLDFDHIDYADEFRDYIFNTYDFVIASFLSSSKRGIKVLIKIPEVSTTDEFKSYFYGLGVLFEKYKGFDGTAQNSVLPLFLCYDPDIQYRTDAKVFKKKGIKLNAFDASTKVDIKDIDIKDGDSKRIYKNVESAFNNIVSDGHPQVIAACVSLGGYVAAGYVDEAEAQSWASSLIRSNSYLQKGVTGYIKTSITAIKTGMRSPLVLENK